MRSMEFSLESWKRGREISGCASNRLELQWSLKEQTGVSQKDSRGICGTSRLRCLIGKRGFPVLKSLSHLMNRIETGPLHRCGASVHSGPPKGHGGTLTSG